MLGEEVNDYIANQFNVRQELYSNTNNRSKSQIQILNNQNAWIKMASGVTLETDENKNLSPFAKEKLKNIEVPEGSLEKYKGKLLAEKFVLFNGVSSLSNNWSGLKNKKGFSTSNFLNSDGSYSKSDFGYVPMPGITGFDIKALNRGSIKKATIKFKLHSKAQFDIFELLYLRLGYTVLVEFGNNIYANSNSLTTQKIGQTLIEDKENGFFSDKFTQGGSYLEILKSIERLRETHGGNYGGFLGKITNFEWSIDNLGSYDVTLNLISLGDVIESLKMNISPNKKVSDFIDLVSSETADLGEAVGDLNSDISQMLWVYRYLQGENNENINRTDDVVYIGATRPDGIKAKQSIGYLMTTTDSGDLGTTTTTIKLIIPKQRIKIGLEYYTSNIKSPQFVEIPLTTFTKSFEQSSNTSESFEGSLNQFVDIVDWKQENIKNHIKKQIDFSQFENNNDSTNKLALDRAIKELQTRIDTREEEITKKQEIINPVSNFNKLDGFRTTQKNPNDYIRLGALLNYIKNNIVPEIVNKNNGVIEEVRGVPIINIYNSNENNYFRDGMFTLPNQLSLDPRVCIVKNQIGKKIAKVGKQSGKDTSQLNYKNITCYRELSPFRELDLEEKEKESYGVGDLYQSNPNRAYIKNIYLNHKFIQEKLSSVDENGDISLYSFFNEICLGINKALGGINNLEPVIDETTNTLYIGETTPIPNQIQNTTSTTPYTLNLFGFDPKGKGNFIRKLDIKTTISPEYASMITIGSTSTGYVKGTNGTAFSKWNKGLTDRFKPALSSPNVENPTTLNALQQAKNNVESVGLLNLPQFQNIQTPPPPPPIIPEPLEQYINRYISLPNRLYIGEKLDNQRDSVLSGEFDINTIEQSLSIVTEFYKYALALKSLENMDSDGVAGGIGFIPFKMSFTMNGIEGVKIYNTLHVNSSFLPQAYGKTLDFIITGVDHSIKNNDWETTISTLVQPKSNTPSSSTVIENYDYLFTDEVNEAIEVANTTVSETKAGNAPNQQTSTTPERDGDRSKGTIGTVGVKPTSELSPTAKSKQEIDSIVAQSGVTNPIRKRIVEIAASYIGQNETPGNNSGWHDPLFQAKMVKPITDSNWGWTRTQPWCDYFTSLVWYEAYTVGNALVGPAESKYTTIFNRSGLTGFDKGAKVESMTDKKGPFGSYVAYTRKYFQRSGKYITIKEAKSGKKLPQPGDMFTTLNSEGSNHIGIVAKVFTKNGKLTQFSTIEGNTGTSNPRDGGLTKYRQKFWSMSIVHGFCQVLTS